MHCECSQGLQTEPGPEKGRILEQAVLCEGLCFTDCVCFVLPSHQQMQTHKNSKATSVWEPGGQAYVGYASIAASVQPNACVRPAHTGTAAQQEQPLRAAWLGETGFVPPMLYSPSFLHKHL